MPYRLGKIQDPCFQEGKTLRLPATANNIIEQPTNLKQPTSKRGDFKLNLLASSRNKYSRTRYSRSHNSTNYGTTYESKPAAGLTTAGLTTAGLTTEGLPIANE